MKKFENVECSGWCSDPNVVTFGTLEDMGLLRKEWVPINTGSGEYEGHDTIWYVIGDVEFTTTYGDTYKKGDVITWYK
jgi:hypothetical protein